MKKNTHAIIGCALAIPLITNPLSLIGLYGSIAPDWDCKLGMKYHRTFTHSFLFLIITSYLLKLVGGEEISSVWFISYASHLFLDSLTVSGVPVLYPIKRKFGLRVFRTGGFIDNNLEIVCWIGLVIIVFQKVLSMINWIFVK